MNDFFDQLLRTSNPILFFLLALMVQSILICLYGALIYGALFCVKAALSKRMSARANYFSWYALLLSLPLASASWNMPVKVALYACLSSGMRWQIISKTLLLAWSAVVVIQLVSQIALTQKINRAIRHLPAFCDSGHLQEKAKRAVGLKTKRLRILVADFVTSPVSYGVFTTSILLPKDYDSRYSAQELYTLLLHEMVHIKNHDTAKAFFISLAECFLWILRPLNQPFRRDTELLCDNRVIGLDASSPNVYGDLLLKECSHSSAVRGIAFSDSYHTLKYRLEGLFRYKPEPHKAAAWAIGLALLPLIAMVYSYWQPAPWLILSEEYNTQFEVCVEQYDPLFDDTIQTRAIELLTVPQVSANGEIVEVCTTDLEQSPEHIQLQQTFEIVDGSLVIDVRALHEALHPLQEQGIPIGRVIFQSPNFIVDTSDAPIDLLRGLSSFYKQYEFDMTAFADSQTNDDYYTIPLEKRGVEENLYLLIARWL
ncbi:M56 family metallopeptidase [Eubacteriales bacterium OttesenSCG-928-K08]|nr:M56 family metallopeptidase [Eubacteriales bacterium OttesenSCG-928-K08]